MTVEPTPTPTPAPNPAPTPTPAPQESTPTPTPDPSDDGKGGKAAILADLAKERDARQALEQKIAEAETSRQAQLDALAKALGLKPDDTPPDPAALTRQVAEEQARAREAAVQLAVYRNAAESGANPDALLDSASFLRSLAEVDPADAAAVAVAIKAAVQGNPRLAAAPAFPAPGAAGIGVGGTFGAPTDPRLRDLAQIEADLAVAKRR